MLNIALSLLLLAAGQADVFKKEMGPLQSAVDTLVTSTGAHVLQRSRAAYIEGYGIVVLLEIAFEQSNIFSTPKPPKELRSVVAQRRAAVREKLEAFVKERVATMDSLGRADSLTIVIHVLNANPVDVPKLPVQIQVAAKKDSPQPVFREF
jgi:hypothetical protein